MPPTFHLPDYERRYLHQLAQQQAEIAALPVMEDRKQMWYALNDAQPGARPPVIIETWTFDRDFMPESIYQCQSELGRQIENKLLRNIRNHELLDDDKVIPNTYDIGWFIEQDEFGVDIPRKTVKDADNIETGYQWEHPIKDLERDLEKLKPITLAVDRKKTFAYQEFLDDLLGEFLPVKIRTGGHVSTMLTNRVVELMGMQNYFMAMYDQPELVHALMAYLRDNALRWMRWMETENLLRVNNGNQDSFGSSYNFTTNLPQPSHDPAHVRLKDCWGASNSQETVGISPRAFREFCLPYYKAVCEPWGQVYYGCCEPASPFWNEISELPNLKKVSISRWCDEAFMGEALRGTEIIYSRKPDPNFLSVDQTLDQEAWAEHIRKTLSVTKGVFTEFIIRDVYTLHGHIKNASNAVSIAKREINRLF